MKAVVDTKYRNGMCPKLLLFNDDIAGCQTQENFMTVKHEISRNTEALPFL
jgi:hypothetical protein